MEEQMQQALILALARQRELALNEAAQSAAALAVVQAQLAQANQRIAELQQPK